MANIKKFLDSDGLTILCRKFQDYPDNEILGTVINAIDNIKVNKEEGKGLSTNDYTNEDKNRLNSSLLYIEQTLTEEQQSTALENIGAADAEHTHNVMIGATYDTVGVAGFVPAPGKGADTRYLRSDGKWMVPPDTKITVDSTMSDSSTNPVQNKAIKAYIDGIVGNVETLLAAL